MSKLAMYIVGLTALPCLNDGFRSSCHSLSFFEEVRHHHLQMLAAFPLSAPVCKFFQFSGSLCFSRRRMIHDAYHFDITDVSTIAQWLLIHFFGSASGFLSKTNLNHLPRTWRFHLAQEAFLETLRNSVKFPKGKLLNHFTYDGIMWPIHLDVAHPGPGLKHQVNRDFSNSSFFGEMLIAFLFKIINSVLLTLLRLLLVSVHSLTMPLQFLLFLSVCCEVSFDIQFRQRFHFRLFLSWLKATIPCFPGLLLEHFPLDICCALCSGFLPHSDTRVLCVIFSLSAFV